MSAASELIERMEAETGQLFDDNNGDNNAMAGCIGAIARLIGKTAHTNYADDPNMDVPVGMYMKAMNTPETKARERSNEMLVAMLSAGMSSDDIMALNRK